MPAHGSPCGRPLLGEPASGPFRRWAPGRSVRSFDAQRHDVVVHVVAVADRKISLPDLVSCPYARRIPAPDCRGLRSTPSCRGRKRIPGQRRPRARTACVPACISERRATRRFFADGTARDPVAGRRHSRPARCPRRRCSRRAPAVPSGRAGFRASTSIPSCSPSAPGSESSSSWPEKSSMPFRESGVCRTASLFVSWSLR